MSTYVRLESSHHDASAEPFSEFERRYLAYALVAYTDLRSILYGTDDEYEAMRSTMADNIKQVYKTTFDALWEFLNAHGFSKWDMRTSWSCHGLFYGDEILDQRNENNRFLRLIMMEYDYGLVGDENEIFPHMDYSAHQGGHELFLTAEQRLKLAKWKQERMAMGEVQS